MTLAAGNLSDCLAEDILLMSFRSDLLSWTAHGNIKGIELVRMMESTLSAQEPERGKYPPMAGPYSRR